MKSKLLIMGALCAVAFTANAQTKGTNTLGFGVNVNTEKSKGNNGEQELKTNSYSIGYGHFIRDNTKIGFDLNYSKSDNENTYFNDNGEARNYGGNLTYQKYFPLVKTLYAYAGGRVGYNYGKQENTGPSQVTVYTTNTYNVGAFGGITWFLSKRFAFETSLLSANASYTELKQKENSTGTTFDYKRTSFNLSSDGFINNLGFKIYILF